MKKKNASRGQILILSLVFGSIAIFLLGGIISWIGLNLRAARQAFAREQAIQIAEAGIEYYRWHLAHAPTDYQDGTGAPGPYIHDFEDKDGNVIGTFELSITPPPVGSTLVIVHSTGTVIGTNSTRAIEARFAKPSIAKFAVVTNDVVRFGEGSEVFGPIHSNQGVRFDGLAHNLITSSVSSYNDPDHGGNNEFGVHTHITSGGGSDTSFRPAEAPPSAVPARPDVFMAGRQFPVPSVDFVGITSDMAQMKADAQSAGRYFAPSGALGYEIVLQTNDTFNLYRVNSLQNTPNNCSNINNESGWGMWSINTTGGATTLLGNYAIPANGLIFLEDHVWVRGQINTARVTIAAARFPDNPATRASIIVNSDLLYTNYDGQDAIALIAQNNFHVGWNSEDDLRIDGAIIAQNGRAGRYYYQPAGQSQNRCAPNHSKSVLTLYGMIASNLRYGFSWSDGTGYATRNIIYDANLLYSPPPNFPLTSDQYVTVSWDEK